MAERADRGEREKSDLIEKVIEVKRVSKVVKGGRRFSFSALVVVGDGKGRVGYGVGKANEVIEAVRKATEQGKKRMIHFSFHKNTIPHQVIGHHGASKVLMRPGAPGSGIISAGPIRAVVEAIGIHDINVKALGSTNAHNLVRSAIDGLSQLRSFADVAARRGKPVSEICTLEY
ncbi:MAG: 30S ribosomal protein S5 [Candidatus Lambdaproteobacteria bacterium RIFOXYD1_FULL_56_27]|uniref:Small ribosomal subunit protein uS5 n=1 Tax=Candidatus Lambdaproteobacteria bacterium RIFOXYD2_FULL_56_26 TaxID=1817773 RepID=A0A1F6GMP6_9PROT|nr:MAG: 30S ribosomal protein S5 [Candidatus Lambdaproteobacteria bacterium RIFOXYD2_FULL_56_26]OGH05628.1 MAG: 30S ribosomal protein S5 [Candidatus Lambdaproteobacteria bacterium RIFOXYC1_FULL_56_13]OGH08588.1 MAG: 30S ribosomal protein S5 [Candidatus Lambdaproteobacteria bacterium RIFOXYD1_FULL_56_27]